MTLGLVLNKYAKKLMSVGTGCCKPWGGGRGPRGNSGEASGTGEPGVARAAKVPPRQNTPRSQGFSFWLPETLKTGRNLAGHQKKTLESLYVSQETLKLWSTQDKCLGVAARLGQCFSVCPGWTRPLENVGKCRFADSQAGVWRFRLHGLRGGLDSRVCPRLRGFELQDTRGYVHAFCRSFLRLPLSPLPPPVCIPAPLPSARALTF